MPSPSCPEPESLALCAEGRLRGPEREAVLRHISSCDDCHTVFVETVLLLEEPSSEQAPARTLANPRAMGGLRHEAPEPADTASPGPTSPAERISHRPDNVTAFERPRWRRIPQAVLAVAAVLGVIVVMTQTSHAPGPPAPMAAASPGLATPSGGSSPSPVVDEPVPAAPRFAGLPRDWPWKVENQAAAFGGPPTERVCAFVGVALADVQAAAPEGVEAVRVRARWARVALEAAGAERPLVAAWDELVASAGPSLTRRQWQAAQGSCDADHVLAGQGLEWARLAALARDGGAWAHPETQRALAAARGLDAGAVADQVDRLSASAGAGDWPAVRALATRLLRERAL